MEAHRQPRPHPRSRLRWVPGHYERVTEVRVAKFGGGQAVYNFQYSSLVLERQGFVSTLCSSESPTVTVNALTRIVMPDGSFYELSYYTSDDSGSILSGGIQALRLPSGGEMRWTYALLIITSQIIDPVPNPPPGPQPLPIQKAYGVAQKELALTVGGPAVSTWTYEYIADLDITVPGEDTVPCHRRIITTDPAGNQTVSFFTTSVRHRWSYSLAGGGSRLASTISRARPKLGSAGGPA